MNRFDKITELLTKFKNGKELYRTSPLFNTAIQMMVEGMNEFEVMEELIKASERINRAFEDYIQRDARPTLPYLNFAGFSVRPPDFDTTPLLPNEESE